MKTIQIQLPEEVYSLISVISNRKKFILSALQEKLHTEKHYLEQDLISGYKKVGKENKKIIKEFSHLDFENWDEY